MVLAIIICYIWGDLTFKSYLRQSTSQHSFFPPSVFLVLGATILAQSVSILGLPQQILENVAESGLDTYSVLLIVILIYLILGCFFDGLSLMIMTLPVVFPLLTGLGFDPIWIGVIITIVIEIGQITPPVGLNLSVLTALTNNDVSLGPRSLCYRTILANPSVRDWHSYSVSSASAFSSQICFFKERKNYDRDHKTQNIWAYFCLL